MDQLELTRAFRAGKLPVPDYVSQIESYFSAREPSILAFLPETERFARLCREAEALISRFPDPGDRPPLFGILLGVKDIFHAGGYVTRAGSRLPAGELQGPEAESVTRLKHAGALILGKSVTTEFAYFTPGPTRNPHNPEHTPGGSSSGSAAAVGAGLCPLALGTQTIGSIIRPAAFCGVVGFKPTYERISRRGIIPLAPSLDHVGFFIPDLHLANPVARELIEDWRPVKMDRKPVLGIPEGPYLACASDYALACFDEICRILSEKGYELRRIRLMDDYQGVRDRHEAILSAEAAQVHKKWFEKYTGLYSLRFSDLVRRGQKITAVRLEKALHDRDVFRAGVAQAMQENQIDLWLAPPTIGPAPEGLDSTGDPVMALPWTQIGLPALNLPTGKSEHGLPMGLQVVGRWGMDEELLAWSGGIANVVSQR